MSARITKHPEKPTHIARILSPKGIYPSRSVILGDSAYVADCELSFCVFKYEKPDEDDPYSEVQWLSIPEIRVYSALMLSVDREENFSAFYPYPFSVSLILDPPNTTIEFALEHVKPILSEKLVEPDILHEGYSVPARNSYRYATDIPMPPVAGGVEYDFRDSGINYDLAVKLHAGINPKDGIAIRGLSTLIKAGMLHYHYQFFEEAINTLYISLEASFRMVIRKLKENGIKEPNAKDAAQFIHDAFYDVNRLEKYFEEDYEKRILSFHPESRYGIYPHPPIMADDYYFLFNDLLEVYAYLLIGFVHPKHKEKLKYHEGAT
jgi:hypothetical protein